MEPKAIGLLRSSPNNRARYGGHYLGMKMELTVRNEASTDGWVAELIEVGFRVQWRPVSFGQTRYIVKAGSEFIQFDQAPSRGRKVRFDAPTDEQKRIIDALKVARVFA